MFFAVGCQAAAAYRLTAENVLKYISWLCTYVTIVACPVHVSMPATAYRLAVHTLLHYSIC